ncbi:DUF445 domain-containing protein [Niallia sp. NCCP-28]|uniref:DUF445 domain-containing protein n=1 Tax=Niallia sp. NCCP-28 TaxID=2934712 RepID=UPI0020810BD7|nr:DUF445 domain-containing protein [Niallia sp. NCCP-28]GKU80638.1 hypothetical protein NCCP28_00340 [Niallia sp. NCCP-28]
MSKKKSSRKLARISLIVMLVGFLGTMPFQDTLWILLLHGGFEAGLIGGLADWFAVTALFRHPLGLPIPHTALLPKNRNRMINGLISVLKNDWLSKESIQDKVKHVPFTEKIYQTAAAKIQTAVFQKLAVSWMQQIIRYMDVEKMTPFVKKQIIATLSNVDMKKILQMISSQLLTEKVDEKALDHILVKVEQWLKKEDTVHKLGNVSMNVLNNVKADGMLQFAIKSIQNLMTEEKLGKIIQNLLISAVKSLRYEYEPNREALLTFIRKEIEGLNENEKVLLGIEKWKIRLLDNWKSDETITETLKQLQLKALDFVEGERFMEEYFLPLAANLLEKMNENKIVIDLWIQKQLSILIENNHDKIGDLVRDNLNKLDDETLTDMIENNVGKDLQWIRVNGAVCGFIIGILLSVVQVVFEIV